MKTPRNAVLIAAALAAALSGAPVLAVQEGPKGPPAPLPGALPALAPGLGALPSLTGPMAAPQVPAIAAPLAGPQAPAPGAVAPGAVPIIAAAAAAAPEAAMPPAVAQRLAEIQASLASIPAMLRAAPDQSHGAGTALQAAVTGEQAIPAAAADLVPAAPAAPSQAQVLAAYVSAAHGVVQKVRAEVSKVIVGQKEMIDAVVMGMILRQHVLLEGYPGVAKTETAKAAAGSVQGSFLRIQGAPDLMPADIVGTVILQENPASGRKEFVTEKGPVFTDLLLVDEINRMTPKAQSALLEAMGEKQVTIGRQTHKLSRAFTVLATQNPVEQDGTYPLPEAQLDRFLFKVSVPQPTEEELDAIGELNATPEAHPEAQPTTTLDELDQVRLVAASIPLDKKLSRYIDRLVTAPQKDEAMSKAVRYYAYTRASIKMKQAVRLHALLAGRSYVNEEDIHAIAPLILRHRIFLKHGHKQSVDEFVAMLLERVPSDPEAAAAAAQKKK